MTPSDLEFIDTEVLSAELLRRTNVGLIVLFKKETLVHDPPFFVEYYTEGEHLEVLGLIENFKTMFVLNTVPRLGLSEEDLSNDPE